MRIIVLLNSMYTGGAEFSTLSLYGWLRKKGYEVKLLCCKEAFPAYHAETFGLETETVLNGKTFWEKLKSLRTIVAEFKPHILHSILFQANILGRFCRWSNPSIVHLESLVNETYSPQRLADPQVSWVKLKAYQLFDFFTQYKGVDHFHANGQSVALHYRKKLGISPARITVVLRGRETNPFVGDTASRKQIRDTLGLKDELLFILVARHEYQKGHDLLFEALAGLGSEREGIRVALVGREGKLTGLLREKSAAGDLGSALLWLGHRSDVPQLLAASDAFIFPSRFEGLPGALIEAEAAGLSIICSDIPNNREVAIANRNAIFFPVNDVNRLLEAMRKMIGDLALRREFAAQSLLIFQEKFFIEKSHRAMQQLIETLIPKK